MTACTAITLIATEEPKGTLAKSAGVRMHVIGVELALGSEVVWKSNYVEVRTHG